MKKGVKLTQKEVSKFCLNKGYELISEYKNARTIIYLKDKEGYICSCRYDSFRRDSPPSRFHKNNPYTIQNIKHFVELNAEGYELISTEYKGSDEYIIFKCPKGHKFEITWNNFKSGYRCPVCSHQKITIENCIATTDPWMMKYFKNKEDGYIYARNSNKKIKVICPDCKKEKEIFISNIYKRKSIQCSCNDGVSYPEKILISLLDQLDIKYKHDNYWIENKRYDFYFEYNDEKRYIIECHGRQHYKQTARKGARTLQEEQDNDQYKKELALKNGIDEYIVLDCRVSELEQIKNSILNSELNSIFDLNNIDWLQCEEFALSNRVKEVCNYWKVHNEVNGENLTTTNISEIFNLGISTIIRYLKCGTKLGWCNYSSTHKNKPVEIFKDGKSLGVFPSCHELSRQSEELFGVKLFQSNICEVCRKEKSQYKGFTFKYVKE